jgi:hypothetical protein
LGLKKRPEKLKRVLAHSPLSESDYNGLELPVHLYMVALESGRMTIDHWSYLLVHTAMILQLAASREHSEITEVATKAYSILNETWVNYNSFGIWTLVETKQELLKLYMTQLGQYYRDFPKDTVLTARQEGAKDLIRVFGQFSAVTA